MMLMLRVFLGPPLVAQGTHQATDRPSDHALNAFSDRASGILYPIFICATSVADFRRDIPQAEIRFYDTGHFALETHGASIAADLTVFFQRNLPPR